MNLWFTDPAAPLEKGVIKRFNARHWTVDFPRGAMASIVAGEDGTSLTVEARFLRANDLVGLIWSSEDKGAHPAHARETARDYSHCQLRFRWRSTGLAPLDAVGGPTLTIEGRDESGSTKTWYVRLWNYAQGTGEDAVIALDFDALDGGFMLPSEAQQVDPQAIERMFISLVAPGHDPQSDAFLAVPQESRVELTDITCDGSGSVIGIGDAMVPEHGLRIATGYDDQYHWAPEKVVDAIQRLGFRGVINHYVGMSHYPALGSDGKVDPGAGINRAAKAWHRGFARSAKALGYEVIWSLSYELLDQFCPEEWKQRAFDGSPALTGYDPPSTLVSPASGTGIDYLARIAAELVDLSVEEGLQPMFQVGEPWWWVTADHRPCLYDDAARALLGGSPVEIADVRGLKSAAEIALLDAAGALLANSTATIAAAAKAAQPETRTHLLAYLPGPLDPNSPEMKRANLPLGWSSPALDVLQLEDYEWVTGGRHDLSRKGRELALQRLGYEAKQTDYFSGFAASKSDWPAIVDAAAEARRSGVAETFIWALPQLLRDGVTLFGEEEDLIPFEDVDFPIAIGAVASVSPAFSTNVVTSASGHEFRNANWSQARLSFDAGPGVRGEEELGELIAFFRARRGPATGFRFRDPFDHSSNGMTRVPSEGDQRIGVGDGFETRFELVKTYGEGERRRITRPVPGSVRVAVDGVAVESGWTLEPMGAVRFAQPPGAGTEITAGFLFDVPVRFSEDRLDVNRETFLAGEAPSVPLVEIREG